ncbi:MAG: hypothetical protein A2622_00380 [Bdellovibrionales bacterium RIFCSPHIGHO2_01_FULL_40_29]|nr:MAG: hypothetical protein A2622_00380 [Bdellovibrionales bacterium RIFCSPHIGHO2_01_FULL_40_29]OFZ32581.1 MAG: hypothetical protein A3D17_04980 [Bdellovibrionales bacterium RIFCSPHIGHO2_02_FULL_40_15]
MNPGLTSSEAAEKLKQSGFNEIKREKKRSLWILIWAQFKSPLVVILIIACGISLFLGEGMQATAIFAILFLNAFIGFFQEYRAENAIEALKGITAPRARVLRDGKQIVVFAREIVSEDLLMLEAGDIIAADAKIIESSNLQVNEAVLTGESFPVAKAVSDIIYMGTAVTTGTALAQVSQTGMKTELGKIAHLLSSAQEQATPLQIQLAQVGKSLLLMCLSVIAVIAVIGFFQGLSGIDILLFSVSLAVAVVPEGLPAIVTVALALGVQRMSARNALIRKLPSVETLGSVTVICTDKTGTLTTGEMRVRELFAKDHVELLRVAASCCDAELNEDGLSGTGDSTEVAILLAAYERGFRKENIEIKNPRISTVPFDSKRRLMSVYRADKTSYIKGALENLIPLCQTFAMNQDEFLKSAEEMAERGLRVLAIATGTTAEEKNLTLIGLIGINDPPRSEAVLAIREARVAGITPIMITGDNPKTAGAIARELGLVTENESLDDRVHARATPEQKLMLVRSWKEKGAIVAMTGDGVNDAPALREAHIGIAMGKSGTEVTRQAADMILADDNFATIISAIKEGRGIFTNIRKAVCYLLVGNFAEVLIVMGAIILGLPPPLLAAHLLWINLVTDALPALTLVADPVSADVMKEKPRATTEKIIGLPEWKSIVITGSVEALVMLVLYWYLMQGQEVVKARSFVFTAVVFSQMLRSFGARSMTQIFWKVGALSNLWLIGVVVATGCIQLSLHFFLLSQKIFSLSPLTIRDFIFLIPFSFISLSVVEFSKIIKPYFNRV